MECIVATSRGRIRGREERGVRVFRGVPYAEPPCGPLRWRPPRPRKPWTGVRDARAVHASAPQTEGLVSRLLGASAEVQDEDCLALNVWTPAASGARRPVLVWIHGGGFTFGSGSSPLYAGAALARRGDVVVVTINYRLGALGFLSLPSLSEVGAPSGNLGLLDQVAALEWVRDNAQVFGGDPDNVTIFGESAGAMSVGTLLAVPAARGLFHRAILQSGAAHNAHTPQVARQVGEAFAAELGIEPSDPVGLRAAPVEALLAAQQRTVERFRSTVGGLVFQPVVDGVVLPRRPIDAVRAGEAAQVPLLIGTNLDEWNLFGLADPKLASLDAAGLARRCARTLPGRDAAGRPLAERVIETYRVARVARQDRAGVSARELWLAIESDRWFRRPAADLAEAAARGGSAAYQYLFTWASPALGGVLGSCHALEIPFVFGTVGEGAMPRFVGEGEAVHRLSRRMQDAWLGFARSGEPGRSAGLAWPGYEPDERHTMILGESCGVASAPHEAERRVWDEVWEGRREAGEP